MTSTIEDQGVLQPTVAALLALDALVDMSRLPAIAGAHLSRPIGGAGTDVWAAVRLQLPSRGDVASSASDLAAWATAMGGTGVRDLRVRVRPMSHPEQTMGLVTFTLRGVSIEVWALFPAGSGLEPGDRTIGDLLRLAGADQ